MAFDPNELFVCSWGDIQLFASRLEWDAGETQVVHDLAAGDLHPVQRRGSRIRKATTQLMFDDFEGAQETGVQAFRRFEISTKERRIFTHPMDGSFFAVIGEFKPSMDEHSVITASCEFIPDGVFAPVAPAGAGTAAAAGETSVTAAADVTAQKLSDNKIGFPPKQMRKLDFSKSFDVSISAAFSVSASASISANVSAEATADVSATASASASASVSAAASASALAFAGVYASALAFAQATAVARATGMTSASAFAFAMASAALDADARASVASWTDEDVSTRKILIDATRLSESIALMIELGGFERDLELWPSFRAAIMLGESIRQAVVAATSETPAIMVVHVKTPTSLLAVAARIYGGLEAQTRARQITGLNDIRTPGWMDPGDYLMPVPPPTAGSAFLSPEE